MSSRSVWAAVFGVAAALVAQAAFAQRVVLLEFEGDRGGKLRTQVVRALTEAGEVEFVPLRDFERAAARAGFRGRTVHSAEAVAAVSRRLPFAAAVGGEVGRTFFVQIFDAGGVELWSKELPVRRGLISSQNAGRLAKAIAAAARTRPKAEPAPVPEPGPQHPPDEPPPPTVVPEADEATTAEEPPRRDQWGVPGEPVTPPARDEDLDRERRTAEPARAGPTLLRVTLAGTNTWRAYCSRPGAQSCAQYDALPEAERPPGDTVQFSPDATYAGVFLGVEFFPLASIGNPVNGLGVLAGVRRGWSVTRVTITGAGSGEPKDVISLDDKWYAQGTYRYYFGWGEREPLVGYVGIKGGLAARTFEVDPAAEVPLPGSHRRYPLVGGEVAIPLARLVRIELGGSYFLNPRPGVDEIAGYGADAGSTGFGVEAGLSGTLWGPLGYSLKVRHDRYKDSYVGQGQKWANGGVAEESYTDLYWGVTAAF